MKTISGKVRATRAISLSRAAKFMSSFVSAESEASNAVSNYLRRTSSAFDELNQLHRQLRSDPYRKKHCSTEKPEPEHKSGVKKEQEEEGGYEVKPTNLDLVKESASKKRRKTEKRSESGGESVNFSGVDEKGDDSAGVVTLKKTEKKKNNEDTKFIENKKEVKSEIEVNVGINESIEKKMKKKKKKGEEGKLGEAHKKGEEFEKNGNVCEESLGIDVGKKKKRKMIEADGVWNDDSEPSSAKKKRRKME